MTLPAYPKYKSSGIDWLGDVPKGWEVKRLKYSASINDEALAETTRPDFEFGYVDIGNVDSAEGIIAKEELMFETAPSRARRIVRDGDTIVSTVRTYLRAIAPIKNPNENLIVSTGFAVIRPRKVRSDFLSYALRESSFVETVVARSVGVSYPAINASEVGTISIPLPPSDEQREIVDFLDRETARLDRLAGKKRELIEKLKEKRTALISRTVTRGLSAEAAAKAGLNPNVKLKPSGIEWLGDIQEHWEVKRLRYLCEIQTGDKDTVDAVDDGDYPFFVRSQIVERISSFTFNCEAVLTAGDGVGVGKVFHHYNGKFDVHQRVYVMTNFRRVSGRYLFLFIRELFHRVALGGEAKSTVDSLRRPIFTDFQVPVPPSEEQAAIVEYLDRETTKLHRMMEKVEAAIEKLQEYRTALITAAVTGKIDVREAAIPAGSTPSRAGSTMPA